MANSGVITPPEKQQQIRDVYERTGSADKTAKECGVSKATVSKYAASTGRQKQSIEREERIRRVHDLVKEGKNSAEIARILGCSRATVRVDMVQTRPLDPKSDDDVDAMLPKSYALEYKPYPIEGNYKCLFIADVHIPFHDRRAVESAVKAGKNRGCNLVFLNGDALDFHGVSRYDHDGCAVTYQNEIEYGKQFFAYLRASFPKARIVYKEGNHEERLERYILSRAPALFGLEGVNLSSLIGLKDHGVEHIGEQRIARLGKLNVIHGHEYGGGVSVPVNAARWLLLRARKPTIMGHLHHTSEQTEQAIDGSMLAAWSVGCLCGLNPRYRRLSARWNHGFALIDTDNTGEFEVMNHKILNGKTL